MMRLSTMRKVDQTIDANGRSPIADEVARPWTPDPGWPRFFRASANFVFGLQRQGELGFLRFADSSERRRDVIEAEVRLVDWLASDGLPVARPLLSDCGNHMESVETGSGTFHAVLLGALKGDQLEIKNLDLAHFRAWGAALGGLHAAMRRYSDGELTARPSWNDHLQWIRSNVAGAPPAVRIELAEIAAALEAFPVHPDNFGLIHGDFELDNLIWQDGAVQVLDFDDAAHWWYSADIAFALRDLFADGFDATNPALLAFTESYAAHHPLDSQSIDQVPIFLRLAKLTTYARIARGLDLMPSLPYPDWLTGLEGKLRARMEAYAASLSL